MKNLWRPIIILSIIIMGSGFAYAIHIKPSKVVASDSASTPTSTTSSTPAPTPPPAVAPTTPADPAATTRTPSQSNASAAASIALQQSIDHAKEQGCRDLGVSENNFAVSGYGIANATYFAAANQALRELTQSNNAMALNDAYQAKITQLKAEQTATKQQYYNIAVSTEQNRGCPVDIIAP